MKQSGVKEPCPMSSIPDFDVVQDYLLDLMHILYNLIHGIHCVIFGDGWGPTTRNYARKMKVHRSWVIAPPARNVGDRRSAAKRLAGKIVGLLRVSAVPYGWTPCSVRTDCASHRMDDVWTIHGMPNNGNSLQTNHHRGDCHRSQRPVQSSGYGV